MSSRYLGRSWILNLHGWMGPEGAEGIRGWWVPKGGFPNLRRPTKPVSLGHTKFKKEFWEHLNRLSRYCIGGVPFMFVWVQVRAERSDLLWVSVGGVTFTVGP